MPLAVPEQKGILELLDHGFLLRTPEFQRSYAWEQVNVREFWRDLVRALGETGTPSDHFLGLVVLDEQSEIQDGQQRLVTTLMIASEIYEFMEGVKTEFESYDGELARNTLSKVSPALRTGADAPLTIGPDDQDELLGRAGIAPVLPESRKRLRRARKLLRQLIEEDLVARTSADAKLSRLDQWANHLRSGAYVIVLRVPHQDAHRIFATLNTRGVQLSNGDKVKSHLIATGRPTSTAVAKWNEVITALKGPAGEYEVDLESFLLHYYGSRYGRTTKGELFSNFLAMVQMQDSLAVLDALIASARIYRALVDPRERRSFWDDIGSGTQQAVELLNGLGLKQVRYLLLAVLRDFAEQKEEKVRRKARRDAIVSIAAWSVRALVHRRLGGGEAEKTFIAAAAAIRAEENPVTTVAELRKVFENRKVLITDDELFKQSFRAYHFDNLTNHTKARAVLYALEHGMSGPKAGMRPGDKLSVEHVLPKSPKEGEWTRFSDSDKREYTYMLGNLLLIDYPSGANNSLANKEWLKKRELIQSWDSQTPLTIDALKHSNWTKQTIEARQDELAELAVRTWPV